MGTGSERTHVAVVGPRLAECGTNRAGSLTTSRPCGPTFVQINERAGLRVAENGADRAVGSTPRPHIRTQINREEWGGAGETKQTEQPRAPAWGNTASNL